MIATTQPEEDGQSIICDILRISPKMACGEDLCTLNSMEDRHEPEAPQDLLIDLSMMQSNEATNSDVENHATKVVQVACDSSCITANSVKMPEDLKPVREVTKVKNLQEAESLDVPSQCSAVSACVGSSSGDLVLDMLGSIKSEFSPNNPQDLALDVIEENHEDGIWSILTDNMHYLKVKSSFDSNPIKFQTPDTTKLTHTAKKRFFNADNNNVPLEEIEMEQHKLKFDRKFKTNGLRKINNMKM